MNIGCLVKHWRRALSWSIGLIFFTFGTIKAAISPRVEMVNSIAAFDTVGPIKTLSGKPYARMMRRELTEPELDAALEFEVSFKMRNMAELQRRIEAGEIISRDEMAAEYYPLVDDYVRVTNWLLSLNLVITRKDDARLAVWCRGAVRDLRQAFDAEFARVASADGEFISAIEPPSVPANLALGLTGINGLQPHLRLHSQSRVVKTVDPGTSTVAAQTIWTPNIESPIYDVRAGWGAGQTIALITTTGFYQSDLDAYYNFNYDGVPKRSIQIVALQGANLPAPDQESTLDIEWASMIAPLATVRVYATGDNQTVSAIHMNQALQQIYDDLPSNPGLKQVSISYGLGETYYSASTLQTLAQRFATLASAGVSVFVASGDGGSRPGPGGEANSGPLQVEYPASDPNVIAVGGTTMTRTPFSEVAWSGSGGGVSGAFDRPGWQKGVGVPQGTKRLVPDVACVADPNTPAYMFLNGKLLLVGGTSWASPVWAGFCALINEARANTGLSSVAPLGPKIYPLIGSSCFYDITQGSNGDYSAGPGYDLCTGIGTPSVFWLAAKLAPQPPITGLATGAGPFYIRADKTLWGYASGGVLGHTLTVFSSVDGNRELNVAADVVAANCGEDTIFFIKSDFSLYGMGSNLSGQIGDGTVIDKTSPVRVANDVLAVSTGLRHTLFLKRDQSLWAMGDNAKGELGDGTTVQRRAPVLIATSVASITAGSDNSFFVKTDGSLWAMGDNSSGQLGDGTMIQRNSPVFVSGNVKSVPTSAVARAYSFFIKGDDSLWGMGDNRFGQLGDGTATTRLSPVRIASNVASAVTYPFGQISFFITSDHTLWGMGLANSIGILGDGTSTTGARLLLQPVKIASDVYSLTGVGSRVGGSDFAVAYLDHVANLWVNSFSYLAPGSTRVLYDNGGARVYRPQLIVNSDSSSATAPPASTIGRIINLSILTSLVSSGETFTMGYVVGGTGTSGTKPLVIRAAGPSLGALGLSGTLADPKIELFAGATKVGENDNWGGSTTIANAMASVGAFGYVGATSRDAAALVNLTAGDNSIKVSAVDNGVGRVIAEVYDATPAASFTSTTPRLINVSVIKPIGSGMTVGFVVAGSAAKTVVIRAVGPTLATAPFNLAGMVSDPQLTLFDGSSTSIASNDNWGTPVGPGAASAAQLTTVFSQISAFALNSGSKDSALFASLLPGNYTVQVSGVGGTTGIALVEIYEVP